MILSGRSGGNKFKLYQYDDFNRLIQYNDGATEAKYSTNNLTTYEYDGLNRLTKVDNGTNVSTYTYDGNNLRQSKTVNGVTTQHIYNGMNVLCRKRKETV